MIIDVGTSIISKDQLYQSIMDSEPQVPTYQVLRRVKHVVDNVSIEKSIPRDQVQQRIDQLNHERPEYRLFDKEIEYRGELVIQRLFNQLTNVKIWANKCKVVENVPVNEEIKQFCLDNHASGWRDAITAADCLYYNGQLVYASYYGPGGFLHRLVALKGYQVLGGYSRLMKRLKKKFPVVTTFANLRWGYPNIYAELNCEDIGYQEVVFKGDSIVPATPEDEMVYVDGPILRFTT